MENKVSNEFLCRMFAAYIGCNAQGQDERNKHFNPYTGRVVEVAEYKISLYGMPCSYDFMPFEVKLILNPLSAISDEDAIGLSAIMNFDYNNNADSEAHYDLAGLRDDIASAGDDFFNCSFDTTQKLIDFLRSKSYDTGFGEIPSLIQAGLAITSLNK